MRSSFGGFEKKNNKKSFDTFFKTKGNNQCFKDGKSITRRKRIQLGLTSDSWQYYQHKESAATYGSITFNTGNIVLYSTKPSSASYTGSVNGIFTKSLIDFFHYKRIRILYTLTTTDNTYSDNEAREYLRCLIMNNKPNNIPTLSADSNWDVYSDVPSDTIKFYPGNAGRTDLLSLTNPIYAEFDITGYNGVGYLYIDNMISNVNTNTGTSTVTITKVELVPNDEYFVSLSGKRLYTNGIYENGFGGLTNMRAGSRGHYLTTGSYIEMYNDYNQAIYWYNEITLGFSTPISLSGKKWLRLKTLASIECVIQCWLSSTFAVDSTTGAPTGTIVAGTDIYPAGTHDTYIDISGIAGDYYLILRHMPIGRHAYQSYICEIELL